MTNRQAQWVLILVLAAVAIVGYVTKPRNIQPICSITETR